MRIALKPLCCAVLSIGLAACGGGLSLQFGDVPAPIVVVSQPVPGSVFHTHLPAVQLSGTVAHAQFIRVEHTSTGIVVPVHVTASGTWFSDPVALLPGENHILVIADGPGGHTAVASITVVRLV